MWWNRYIWLNINNRIIRGRVGTITPINKTVKWKGGMCRSAVGQLQLQCFEPRHHEQLRHDRIFLIRTEGYNYALGAKKVISKHPNPYEDDEGSCKKKVKTSKNSIRKIGLGCHVCKNAFKKGSKRAKCHCNKYAHPKCLEKCVWFFFHCIKVSVIWFFYGN